MKRVLAITALVFALGVSGSGPRSFAGRAATQDVFEVFHEGLLHGDLIRSGVTPAPAQSSDADGESAEGDSARLERLKKLTFDRRPSAILEAWSTPPEESEPPEEPESAEEPAAAATEETPDEPSSEAEEEAPEDAEEPSSTEPSEGEPEAEAADAEAEEARRAAEEKAAEEKAEAEAAAARAEAEKKALDAEVEALQRDVTLGNWAAVAAYMQGLTEAERKAGYEQLLKSLVEGPPKPKSPFVKFAEKNTFAPPDIIGLAAAGPEEVDPKSLEQLGLLLRQCVDEGNLIEQCTRELEAALASGALQLERSDVARIVIGAGFPIEAGMFLPAPEDARAANDRAGLNLLARHYLAKHAEDKKSDFLERAWEVTQAVLGDGELEDEDKEEALKRAVEIAPKIREELGQDWLEESFTARPLRGMEILSVIGSSVSNGMMSQAREVDDRFKGLELQTTATEALLAAAPELAGEWASTLGLLALSWLREAQFTYQYDLSTQRGPSLQRDPFGNFFYYNPRSGSSSNRNMPVAITADDILDTVPSNAWLEYVDSALRPKFDMVIAQLLLKVNEEAEAFPYIERLARDHPARGEELVEEFLRVWTRNHNPNSSNSRTNSYMFIYGFDQRANAIPLTRSKQDRNLAELADWVARLRKLPLESIDEELIAGAFTAAHSAAEVYRISTIEQVFGDLEGLEPKTLAELVQKMRTNLVGVWRQPAVQKENKTRRRQKDIQNEVLRGYEVAREVVEQGLEDHPGDWALVLAKASVMHDENNYRQEIEKTTEFAGRRQEAFAIFEDAARLYADALPELSEEEEQAKVYATWFYASLGACDLNAIDHEKQPVEAQLEHIRAAMQSLPGEAAERHLGLFANTLFTRMSNVNPAVKFRYVRSGLEIVGDHERAAEAREVFEYYSDLVTEIRLETAIDGGDEVGHDEPFGMFVNIRHTREIEREAGGFSKYLVNQNNQAYGYNYGRPTEDYRDKFEDAARDALKEHFEVHSITFNHPDTHSRAAEEYGWRITPYAYVLLQPRGPEVDRVPPLRLDLDFLDTSGYAVLPAESSPLPIDATSPRVGGQPYGNVHITQTLDERQAGEGKLLLEVKARARGLVPRLEDLLELEPAQFDIVDVEDQGVSVSKFDEESEGIEVQSERIWLISMVAQEELEALPDTFQFGSALGEDVEMERQRFVDADLESVGPSVDLEQRYGERKNNTVLAVGLGLAGMLLLSALGFIALKKTGAKARPTRRFDMPESLSPFTVIGLLRDIEANNGVSDTERDQLHAHIADLERHYFQKDGREAPDLRSIAESWVERMS